MKKLVLVLATACTATVSGTQQPPPEDQRVPGLRGDYFDGDAFQTPIWSRTDATIDFDWMRGAPFAGMPDDHYSIRWTGFVEPEVADTYTFCTVADDGARLVIDGTTLVDDWTGHAAERNCGTIALDAAPVAIALEYDDLTNDASVQLVWSSASIAEEVVPEARLFSAAIGPQPPIRPTNLRVVAAAASSVTIGWDDNSADETGFAIERAMPGSAYEMIGTADPDATSFVDPQVDTAIYTYRLTAVNAAGASAYSNVVTASAGASGVVPPPVGTLYRVTDYGAVPNDANDDTAAILAAINAAPAGNTVYFPTGTYQVGAVTLTKAGITLYGEDGAILHTGLVNGNDSFPIKIAAANLTLRNLIIHGCGVLVGAGNTGFAIDYDVFRMDCPSTTNLSCGGEARDGICLSSTPENFAITNNFFTEVGQGGSYAIFGGQNVGYRNGLVAYNESIHVGAGFHMDAFGGTYGEAHPEMWGLNAPFYNLTVKQNYFSADRGMGLEYQGGAHDVTFEDNWFEAPDLSSDPRRNLNSFAYSLIIDMGAKIRVHRNAVIPIPLSQTCPDWNKPVYNSTGGVQTVGTCTRVGFELGGDDNIAEDNWIAAGWIGPSGFNTDGRGSCSVTFQNNRVEAGGNFYTAFPSATCGSTITNDGASVTLTWDTNRGKPGIGGGFQPARSGRSNQF